MKKYDMHEIQKKDDLIQWAGWVNYASNTKDIVELQDIYARSNSDEIIQMIIDLHSAKDSRTTNIFFSIQKSQGWSEAWDKTKAVMNRIVQADADRMIKENLAEIRKENDELATQNIQLSHNNSALKLSLKEVTEKHEQLEKKYNQLVTTSNNLSADKRTLEADNLKLLPYKEKVERSVKLPVKDSTKFVLRLDKTGELVADVYWSGDLTKESDGEISGGNGNFIIYKR